MSYLPYLYLFVYSNIQHILCCIFALFVFVLCTQCCQCLCITHSWLPCRLSLTFIYLVYPALPVSLDYPFLVALSLVSNVYLSCVPSVASVSGLPILGCPVGCLWITHSWLPCRLSLTFIYLVYPVLPVSLYYPFCVALSVVSRLPILGFGCL
jgi:hypothetical protein